MGHKCHAINCYRTVPPKMLMCRKHWFMVDPELRYRIWATYVPGQEITKDPSSEYLEAAKQAIKCVRDKEESLI